MTFKASPDGTTALTAFTGPGDGAFVPSSSVMVWDLKKMVCIGTIGNYAEVLDFALNAAGDIVAISADDRTDIWYLPTRTRLSSLPLAGWLKNDVQGELQLLDFWNGKSTAVRVPKDGRQWAYVLGEALLASSR